nr:Maf family protein [Oceanobacillus limi]
MMKSLILASSSPRRQELLNQVNIPFTIRKQTFDESLIRTSDPVEKVQQLAKSKGENVSLLKENEVILSADTVVSYKQQIFEKPKNQEDAYNMLSTLCGNTHAVYTGYMIRSSEHHVIRVEKTEVEFWNLTEQEMNWYLSTTEPYDKAGGYGIQQIGAMFVKKIKGDYFNVVGLPLSTVVRDLRDFSIHPEVKN